MAGPARVEPAAITADCLDSLVGGMAGRKSLRRVLTTYLNHVRCKQLARTQNKTPSVARRTRFIEDRQVQALREGDSSDAGASLARGLDALSSPHARVRAAAIELLAAFPNEPRVRRALIPAFEDKAWIVRMQAAEAAAQLGNHAAIRRLRRLLTDPHELVRLEAVTSLGFLRDRGARRGLYALLRDRSALVRSYAAAAIGRFGDSRDLQRLRDHLAREKNDAARLGYYDAIISLGDPSALPSLTGLLNSDDFEVRCAAATTLVRCVANASNAVQLGVALRRRLRREPSPNTRACLRENIRTLHHEFRLQGRLKDSAHKPAKGA